MLTDTIKPVDRFTIFGFVKHSQPLISKLFETLGLTPRLVDFGRAGVLFFYSNYADVAESVETIVLKLGFVRSPNMSSLNAQQLLTQKVVTPQVIDHRLFRGNALVAGFDKQEPRFLVYQTLLSSSSLYYSTVNGDLLCATGPRYLAAMLDKVELNPAAIVPQCLFGAVPGPATHLRNVYRLFPGELLAWRDGRVDIKQVRDLHFDDEHSFKQADNQTIEALYEQIKVVIGAYLDDIDRSNLGFANLLSGGVDSSLLQLAISQQFTSRRARSFSYVIQSPDFEHEIAYARQASSIFDTEHHFVEIKEAEFPELLLQATHLLGQPVFTSAEVCKFGLTQAIARMSDPPQYVFSGQGADTLFGLRVAKKLKAIEYLQPWPALTTGLWLTGSLLKPFSQRGQTLLNLTDILNHLDDPDHLTAPMNTTAAVRDLSLACRCLGTEAVSQALADRRYREAQYLNSQNYPEKVHVMDLLSDCYNGVAQGSQIYRIGGQEVIFPFLDEEMVRFAFKFKPQIRYVNRWRNKYLLKKIMESKTTSPITRQRKGGSMFHAELHRWMKHGCLRDMIDSLSLPSGLSRSDLTQLIDHPPSTLVWHLLAFEIFQKQVLQVKWPGPQGEMAAPLVLEQQPNKFVS